MTLYGKHFKVNYVLVLDSSTVLAHTYQYTRILSDLDKPNLYVRVLV